MFCSNRNIFNYKRKIHKLAFFLLSSIPLAEQQTFSCWSCRVQRPEEEFVLKAVEVEIHVSHFPHVTWMRHETAEGGKGGSLLLPLFLLPRAWQQQHLRALFPLLSDILYQPPPRRPVRSIALPPPTPRPSLFFAVWSPLRELQLNFFLFFFVDGGCRDEFTRHTYRQWAG